MKTEVSFPANRAYFAADVQVGNNGDESKSAPLRMIARSGNPVNVPGFGRVVHDFAGMKVKSRIPVDYNHDRAEVIGYLNQFSTERGDLECSGALVPGRSEDRAAEVIHKSHAGVPYEASINFGGEMRAERVVEGETVEVNGRQLEGPLTVIREWSLRGVAVCPYGMDAATSSAAFSADETLQMTIEETEMSEEKTVAETEDEKTTTEVVDATSEGESAEDETSVEAPEQGESTEGEVAETELSMGERFLREFGDRGGVWFAKGMSLDDARVQCITELREQNEALSKENQSLRAELSELKAEGGEALEFQARDQKPKSDGSRMSREFGLTESQGRLAEGFAKRFAKRREQV